MKAIIKETGQSVEVVSRFMPKKRNAPGRAWVCVLSDGRTIDEDAIEYIKRKHPSATRPDSPERKPIAFEHRILGRVDISSCCD